MTLQPPILVVEDSEDHVLLLRHAFKKAGNLGANAFLTKPVELEKLIEMMKVFRAHWLEFAQVPQSTRSAH